MTFSSLGPLVMTPPLFLEVVVAGRLPVANVAVGSLDAEIAPTVVPPPS